MRSGLFPLHTRDDSAGRTVAGLKAWHRGGDSGRGNARRRLRSLALSVSREYSLCITLRVGAPLRVCRVRGKLTASFLPRTSPLQAFRVAQMKYHALNPDTPCPNCGRPRLGYKRHGRFADEYACAECHCRVMHWRPRGQFTCGVAVRSGFSSGMWRPCPWVAVVRDGRPPLGT